MKVNTATKKRENKIARSISPYELERRQKRLHDDRILIASHTLSFVNTILLLRGSQALPALVSSMISVKLFSGLHDEERTQLGAASKACISLFFSGAAYCFDSRGMEKAGGVLLAYFQFMALPL